MARKNKTQNNTNDELSFDKPADLNFDNEALSFAGGDEIRFEDLPAVPDPLADVEYENRVEPDAKRELSALEQAFKARKLAEAQRFALNTDSEYWVAFCFPSREAKEKFLELVGLLADGDKYLDGMKAARKLGFDIQTPETPLATTFNVNKRWDDLVMD